MWFEQSRETALVESSRTGVGWAIPGVRNRSDEGPGLITRALQPVAEPAGRCLGLLPRIVVDVQEFARSAERTWRVRDAAGAMSG